jgi:dTDP-4-dehydrorhamnose reductase
MKLLVFGGTGQVGRELARLLPDSRFPGRAEADLTDPAACAALIAATDAEAVINAAAYTAVDRAETEEALATAINAAAPAAMAAAAAARGLPFVQLSSDYVFGGAGTRPQAPTDRTAPVNAYGRSKLAGERGVLAAGGRALVLRSSWVFSAQGPNFVTTMLRLGRERQHLRIVADQIGGPTPAGAIAAACLTLAEGLAAGGPAGIYHLAGTPDISWAGFAREIFRQSGLAPQVEEIPTAEYPAPARRPLNSRLDCAGLERDYGIARPDWGAGLARVLAELAEKPA